jgi:hypothetical protein
MISNDLLKRTPVRLAGAFAILFALTVIALVTVLYFTLVSELEGDIRQRVEEMSDTLRAIDAQQGFNGLAAVVANAAKSVGDRQYLPAAQWTAPSGWQRKTRVQGWAMDVASHGRTRAAPTTASLPGAGLEGTSSSATATSCARYRILWAWARWGYRHHPARGLAGSWRGGAQKIDVFARRWVIGRNSSACGHPRR